MELNRKIVGDILSGAMHAVAGPRAQTHGDTTFTDMAALASAYLGIPISPSQASWLMVLFKLARTKTGDKAYMDHYLDAAAYAAIAGALEIDSRNELRSKQEQQTKEPVYHGSNVLYKKVEDVEKEMDEALDRARERVAQAMVQGEQI